MKKIIITLIVGVMLGSCMNSNNKVIETQEPAFTFTAEQLKRYSTKDSLYQEWKGSVNLRASALLMVEIYHTYQDFYHACDEEEIAKAWEDGILLQMKHATRFVDEEEVILFDQLLRERRGETDLSKITSLNQTLHVLKYGT